MAIISVPKPLRDKLGDEGSDALIDILNKTQENQKENIIEIVGEKFERRLSEEISGVNQHIDQLRAELKGDIAGLRAELKEDNANLRAELKEDNANLRADIIKWMFIFWTGQMITILGALALLLR